MPSTWTMPYAGPGRGTSRQDAGRGRRIDNAWVTWYIHAKLDVYLKGGACSRWMTSMMRHRPRTASSDLHCLHAHVIGRRSGSCSAIDSRSTIFGIVGPISRRQYWQVSAIVRWEPSSAPSRE